MGAIKTTLYVCASIFLASMAYQLATGHAPLDGFNALVGSPKLFDPKAMTKRERPVEGVEHVACRNTKNGCEPVGGCIKRGLGCEPRIGHYWMGKAAPEPEGLFALLPPVPPPIHMMTTRGEMLAEPGFWLTSYRLLSAPADDHIMFSTLPGFKTGIRITYYLVLPAMVIFLLAITCIR